MKMAVFTLYFKKTVLQVLRKELENRTLKKERDVRKQNAHNRMQKETFHEAVRRLPVLIMIGKRMRLEPFGEEAAMRRIIYLLLISILLTACNIPSINTWLNEDSSGTNTIIIAVPNDCSDLLTLFHPTVKESLEILKEEERKNGIEMEIRPYQGNGLVGFEVVFPFKDGQMITTQLNELKTVIPVLSNVQYPIVNIPPPTEDKFKKTYKATIKINPMNLLLGVNCSSDRIFYSLKMPGTITSYSPNSDQPYLSVYKTGDATVEWKLEKKDQWFTLEAESSIVKSTPPALITTVINSYLAPILGVIVAILAIIQGVRSLTKRNQK